MDILEYEMGKKYVGYLPLDHISYIDRVPSLKGNKN